MPSSTFHAVDFSGINVLFDFIDLSVNQAVALDPSFEQIFFSGAFEDFSGEATMDVSASKFNEVFLVNIQYQDLSDGTYSSLKYALDSTKFNDNDDISFSNAMVTPETAVNVNLADDSQTITNDFVRHILKEATGSLYLNALFVNKAELVAATSELDASFNIALRTSLQSVGGTTSAPLDNTTIINNPVRVLINSILGEDDDTLSNPNDARRISIINHFQTEVNTAYNDASNTAFYVNGTTDNDGTGYFFPLYTDASASALSGGYNSLSFGVDTFRDRVFYMPSSGGTLAGADEAAAQAAATNFEDLDGRFIKVPMMAGDKLAIKLTYEPKTSTFLGNTINPRKYKFNLNLV